MHIEKQSMLDQFNQYVLAETNSLLPHWRDYIEIESLFIKNGRSIHLVSKQLSDEQYLLKEFSTNDLSLCREATMMSDLCHSAIPKIVDQFIDHEHIILVRDYIQGQSLEALLREKGCLSEKDALDILLQLCDIVKYLHGRQPYPLIHRDIKPANLILDEQKKVWLIDFDSAREYKPHASSDTQYFGTQGYAAPEQYGFSQTDRRTDIFSLGALLHFMLTGRQLDETKASSDNQLKNVTIASGLLCIINKCNRFDPDRRYRSVKQLIQALKFYQRRIGIRIATTMAISLLCVLGLLLYQQILFQPASGADQTSVSIEIADGTSHETGLSETTVAAKEALPETVSIETTASLAENTPSKPQQLQQY
jgi:serine/threonine protein kinase